MKTYLHLITGSLNSIEFSIENFSFLLNVFVLQSSRLSSFSARIMSSNFLQICFSNFDCRVCSLAFESCSSNLLNFNDLINYFLRSIHSFFFKNICTYKLKKKKIMRISKIKTFG